MTQSATGRLISEREIERLTRDFNLAVKVLYKGNLPSLRRLHGVGQTTLSKLTTNSLELFHKTNSHPPRIRSAPESILSDLKCETIEEVIAKARQISPESFEVDSFDKELQEALDNLKAAMERASTLLEKGSRLLQSTNSPATNSAPVPATPAVT